MKKVKSLLLVAVLSFTLFTANVFAKDKVKVYIFEAGGCPYCEAETEYLEGLSSYGEKFEIIKKELYVDHVEWKEGEDYDLGVKVAEAFMSKGYSQASYQGTPFVVISNIYAASSYNESLESVIDEAYEAGDEDIVGCFEDGEDDCADKIKESSGTTNTQTTTEPTTGETENTTEEKGSATAAIILVLVAGAVVALLVVVRGKNKTENKEETKKETKKEIKTEPKKEEVKETTKKAPVKKTTTKKTATKKTTTKKAPAKKTATKKTTKK